MIDSAKQNKPTVNVGAQRVAAVYAKAFLGAAEKSGQTEALIEELAAVRAVLNQYPKLEAVFASALVPHEEKAQLLDRLFAKGLSPLSLDGLKVLARRGRLDLVRAVEDEVRKLYDQRRGRVRVELRTATPLEDGLSRSLADSLRKIVGGEPEVEPSVDPALIGGVVLRVGDTVYDASVAWQLQKVRQSMITRSVHEIQSRRDRFRHPGGN